MPWINGRYYMNPAYGRALERARMAEEGRVWSEEVPSSGQRTVSDEDFWDDPPRSAPQRSPQTQSQQQSSNAHWVTINGRHVPIDEARAPHARNERERRLANVVYNETASLRPRTGVADGQPGSADNLQSARVAIAEVANRVVNAGYPRRVAPSELSETESEALVLGNPDVVGAYNASLAAARQALAGSNITSGATQYRFRENGDINTPIAGRSPVTMHFGPFLDNRRGRNPKTIVVAHEKLNFGHAFRNSGSIPLLLLPDGFDSAGAGTAP